MSVPIDPVTVRQFFEIISGHTCAVINGDGPTGVLQLVRLNPLDDKVLPSRFAIDDVEGMVAAAVCDAASCNIYIEARTVRPGLRGKQRGELNDTQYVFALVIDSDADKGMGGNITVRPSLVVETSPGNFHYWYLLTRAIDAVQAQKIGQAIRDGSGADKDSGVVTQCYRVPGTPNFPCARKQARGRVTIEPTRMIEQTGRLWDPDELLAAFASPAAPVAAGNGTGCDSTNPDADETSLPADLLDDIRNGGNCRGNDASRSALFHKIIGDLKRRHWTAEAITRLLEKYGNGIAAKYAGRLAQEVERSYNKIVVTGAVSSSPPSPPPPPPPPGVTAGSAIPGATPSPTPHVLPTIRLIGGQLPRAVAETEAALRAAGTEVFSRAGSLVYPVAETVTAADGRKTMMARLSAFTANSFTEPVAESAIFQRYSIRRKVWVDTDQPLQIVNMVLARESRWTFPRVSGIITTPTLRADGSLLALPGYDSRTELYLMPGLTLPPIPERPSREEAEKALATLKEPFSEFSFKQKALDRSVALAGLQTALLRGSLPTSPVCLVKGDGPGVGKSMLVDVIAIVATGRLCPVITASRNAEETEKRIGAVLLSGSPIVSLDNIVHDLGGELLCQVTERPIVRIRILGRSEMPDCECHTAVFATGNGVSFQGDMIRRGLMCNLEALSERPELREFSRDALQLAVDNRAAYVAAALTVVRAYLVAGSPRQCGPLGSYTAWSKMVRSPLIWLGEPDPVLSMNEIRNEDPELANIGEFFQLWQDYGFGLNTPYTTARIIELACAATPNSYNPPWFKNFLLRIAARKGEKADVSPERLGWWLRRISGRIVGGKRLVKGHTRPHVADFRLVNA